MQEDIEQLRKQVAARQQQINDEYGSEQKPRESQSTGLALSARVGVDVKLTEAIAIRVADAGYLYSWNSHLDGINYSQTLQLTTGLIVRFGTS